MEQLLVAVTVFLSVAGVGGAILLYRAGLRKPLESRLHGTFGSEPVAPPLRSRLRRLAEAMIPVGAGLMKGRPSPKLEEQMFQAGYGNPNAVAVYLGAKVLLLLTGTVLSVSLLLAAGRPMIQVVAGAGIASLTLFFIPNLVVHVQRARRVQEIRCRLPDALDLLEICVSSGMGLETAWNSVAEEIRRVSPTLADEMALVDLELHLGASRAEAMRHMAARTGSTDISSLVAILVQSERFGTSIATALQTYAESLRQIRKQRARECAEKAAVKLLIPMILFIFPAILIVLVGPAGIRISATFRSW